MKKLIFGIILTTAFVFLIKSSNAEDIPFVVEGIYVADWTDQDGIWNLVCQANENSVCAIGVMSEGGSQYSITVDPHGINKAIEAAAYLGSITSPSGIIYQYRLEN